jgi:hypothetical protein
LFFTKEAFSHYFNIPKMEVALYTMRYLSSEAETTAQEDALCLPAEVRMFDAGGHYAFIKGFSFQRYALSALRYALMRKGGFQNG